MLSKNTLKFIKSLHQKKFRKQEQAFFVEGAKNVIELLGSDYTCTHLLYTDKFAASWPDMVTGFSGDKVNVLPTILKSLGTFSSNDQAMALATSKPNLPKNPLLTSPLQSPPLLPPSLISTQTNSALRISNIQTAS
jgi:TrmH family RNA methyltransferase